ncbi:SsrA-binding protein SmpB [Candidatus Saccharibacteria bacterium]|nr:SsrA-binding protein SmpB [Candidatus Saccharibacteria bacterium]
MAKKNSVSQTKIISNRRARHDYTIKDDVVVGIVLTGAETKSLRLGNGQLRGAYIAIKDNELWLVNATISGTSGIPIDENNKSRTRKLLAKRRQIDALIQAKQQGQAIVPLNIITSGRFIKVRIAAGRGKKLYDKRQTIKERDQNRQARNSIKQQNRI